MHLVHEVFISAGEGPYLKLFSQEGSLLVQQEVLPSGTVHGIRIGTQIYTWLVLNCLQWLRKAVVTLHHELPNDWCDRS